MRRISLRDVSLATGGSLEGGGSRLPGVSGVFTDTRGEPADLFIALKGENFDGHSYIERAAEMGARAAIARRGSRRAAEAARRLPGFPLVLVDDTLRAMGDLAASVRASLDLMVAGVTGTTGKTCTKDFLRSVLSTTWRTAGSSGSHNNEVGLPMTILGLGTGDRALVVEMGARRPGDIGRLAEIARPGFGIITNIGPGHLELFGSLEAVAATKGELARALPASGVLALSADDPWTGKISRETPARIVRFGTGRAGDIRSARTTLDGLGRAVFEMRFDGFREVVRLPVPGRHQVPNALAAAACAMGMGVPPDRVAAGLEKMRPGRWRMEVVEAPGGFTVINDSYNANPQSTEAALLTLAEMGRGKRTIAVLGPMAELGAESERYHERAGETVVEQDVDLLVAVGKKARPYTAAALSSGMARGSVFRCEDVDEAFVLLSQVLEPGDLVLVKASRVFGLDRLAEMMIEPGFPGGELADV